MHNRQREALIQIHISHHVKTRLALFFPAMPRLTISLEGEVLLRQVNIDRVPAEALFSDDRVEPRGDEKVDELPRQIAGTVSQRTVSARFVSAFIAVLKQASALSRASLGTTWTSTRALISHLHETKLRPTFWGPCAA